MGLWKASRLPGRPIPADDDGRAIRRPAVVGAGWAAAAVVATLIGLGAIRLVGDSLTSTPGGVLSQDQVDGALAQVSDSPSVTQTPASTTPTTEPAPATETTRSTSTATGQRSFSVRGGTAIAVCSGSQAYLVSWSPAPGYRVDRTRQGPDHEVEVRFDGGHGHSEIKIRCDNGIPYADKQDDD
jgi:serine/threonine-protein kinase